MRKLIALLSLSIFAAAAFAQKPDRPIVQFTGIVNNQDSPDVIVPYVGIVNSSLQNQVNISNYKGYFSFPVHERDTIRFSCVGYSGVTVIIPSDISSHSYTVQVSLKPQIVNLPVFHVFPWATTEEFRKDFITMKLADDDLEIAEKNVSRSSLDALGRSLPRDAYETYSFQDFHNNVVNSHSTVNPLLNPFNWGSMIKEISDGDKSRGVESNN